MKRRLSLLASNRPRDDPVRLIKTMGLVVRQERGQLRHRDGRKRGTMSTILDALKRVEERLRNDAGRPPGGGTKTADGLTSGPDLSKARDDSSIQLKEAVPGENEEVMEVYLRLADMLARIQDRVQVEMEEGRAEARSANAELVQAMAALQNDFARQREALRKEIQQRDAEREAGRVALAAAQSQTDSLRQLVVETRGANAKLAQAMAALQNDFARQIESLQEEIPQRDAEREAGKVVLAAAQPQIDALRQLLAETSEANAELTQAMAALHNDFARQREALQEEIQQREAEREAGKVALAAAQSQIDSLRQTLADREAAIADAQDKMPLAAGADANVPARDEWRYSTSEAVDEETKPMAHLDKDEARRLHTAAVEAYVKGDFTEALHLLDIIDSAFPGNKSIVYNRAECLIGLGRNDEARRLCDYLVTVLNHAPAEELKSRIKD